MTKKNVILADIICVTQWTAFLCFFVDILKTELYDLDTNHFYFFTKISFVILIPIYIYFFVSKKLFINILLSLFTAFISIGLSTHIVDAFIKLLYDTYYHSSYSLRPYIFKWFDLVLINFISLAILEIASRLIKKINANMTEKKLNL